VHDDRDGALDDIMRHLIPDIRRSLPGQVLAFATAVAVIVAVAGGVSRGAGDEGERRLVAQSRFTVTDAPRQAEVVLLVVDFPPGAWTSWHTHGGQAVNLVLEGEITLRHAGAEWLHRAGQAWTDSTSQVHTAGNTGAGKARLLTTFLLPKDAPQITDVQGSRFEPTVVHEARFPLPALPADAEIVQQAAELPSGWRSQRILGAFVASIVVDGEVTYKIGAERRKYRAGDAWSARAGTAITEENGSPGVARVFATQLLARGAGR
jgi:quercetin dioxygenase-like cupin family protein